jgi:hypothetical protein
MVRRSGRPETNPIRKATIMGLLKKTLTTDALFAGIIAAPRPYFPVVIFYSRSNRQSSS